MDNSHTSAICREMDGKHFTMNEYKPGVAAPPFHLWCRSVTAPYFDDEYSKEGKRAARDDDGKTYYVLSDMTYEEWGKKFVGDANISLEQSAIKNNGVHNKWTVDYKVINSKKIS